VILALKIALCLMVAGCVAFVADYTRLTRGAAWRDPVGRAVIVSCVFAAGECVPWLLAAFFRFSTIGNQVAAWAWIVFLFLGGAAMFWRTWVFERNDPLRKGKQ